MDEQATPTDDRSLRDVAAWLTTPARSGVFLTAHDLRRVGIAVGIQVTPLNRRFAVEQLFRSAAIEGTLDELLNSLISEIEAHLATYQTCDVAQMAPWIEQAGHTVAELQEMRQIGRSSDLA